MVRKNGNRFSQKIMPRHYQLSSIEVKTFMISSQQFMISSQQDERSNLPSDHMVTEISAFREDNDMKIITSTVLALSLTARSLTRRTRGSFLLHSQRQR